MHTGSVVLPIVMVHWVVRWFVPVGWGWVSFMLLLVLPPAVAWTESPVGS